MSSHVSEKDVRDMAEYTRIHLEEDEVSTMTGELNDIIDELGAILEYDLEGVPPTFHPIGGLSNVMREDTVVDTFTQEEALSNAPAAQEGCFLIPSILGEGGDR